MTRKAVLIFTKVPSPGFVKTRLTQETCLSDEDVALIAEAMLKDTLFLACKCDTDRVELGYMPETGISNLEKLVNAVRNDGLLTKPVSYLLQKGSNFDERFSSVVKASFESETDYLVVIGADLPYLDPIIINHAFNQLLNSDTKEKIVIGPASGGGIYLVGMAANFDVNRFIKYSLFRGGVEISQFVNLCKSEKIDFILLPLLIDIDIEEDLVTLISLIEALEIAKTHEHLHFPRYTAKILKELGVIIEEIPGETRKRKIGKLKRS